jgi:DNA-binding GntR family transcriptional regulator
MSAVIRSLHGPSPAEVAARKLAESIHGAELRPGQELDLSDFAQAHDVRPHALRAELASLVTSGLIDVVGDRAMVSRLDPSFLAEVLEMRRMMHNSLFIRGVDLIESRVLDEVHAVLRAQHEHLVRTRAATLTDAVAFNKTVRTLLLRIARPVCGDADLGSLVGLFRASRRYLILGWTVGNRVHDPEGQAPVADLFDSIDYLCELIDAIRLRQPGAITVAYGKYIDQIEEIAYASLISEYALASKARRRFFAVPDL